MDATRALLISIVGFGMVACDAADNAIDPGDLQLRDLLGFEPEVAAGWDAEQRASARAVIRRGLAEAGAPITAPLGLGIEVDERVARALATVDQRLDAADLAALGVVRFRLTGLALDADPVPISAADGAPPPMTLELAPAWQGSRTGPALAARGEDLLAVLATDVGHDDSPLLVVPAPRLTVVAAYVEPVPVGSRAGADGRAHLLINPVALAALEPSADEAALLAAGATATGSDATPPPQRWTRRIAILDDAAVTAPASDRVASANPYSFHGSIGECAYAEQLRCQSCLPSSTCSARTLDSDGNSECTAFAADDGRGYALFCVNQAVSISGVEACLSDAAPGCAIDGGAASSLAELADNAGLVDDATCAGALDGCLADIYGESEGTYPPPVGEDPTPPRDITGCSGSDSTCSADPSCNAAGPSCNNSLSCDSTCASSSDQSGCDGCSDSCASDSSSGGGGGSCSSCESDSGSSGSDGCGSCDSDSGSGGSDGGCGSCSSDSSTEDSGSCGSCGGGGESSGCSGGSCGGGGGGGSSGCNVATRRQPARPIGLIVQLLCVLSPIPAAAWVRRRHRKRTQQQARDAEVPS